MVVSELYEYISAVPAAVTKTGTGIQLIEMLTKYKIKVHWFRWKIHLHGVLYDALFIVQYTVQTNTGRKMGHMMDSTPKRMSLYIDMYITHIFLFFSFSPDSHANDDT